MTSSLADIRRDYKLATLNEKDLSPNPIRQFDRWWDEACKSEIDEVNAMTLATVSPEGIPSARIVLLKDYDDRGFTFYTNYESRKGAELMAIPQACLLFFWKELERQIRIEGICRQVEGSESDKYFQSRPVDSQLGAWASPQSRILQDRKQLEKQVAEIESRFRGQTIPRPPHWGGFRLTPTSMEFWQGRPSRLHDRIRYRVLEPDGWHIERLAP